eukprot:7690925-Pyramimonas_sp.AAC.1
MAHAHAEHARRRDRLSAPQSTGSLNTLVHGPYAHAEHASPRLRPSLSSPQSREQRVRAQT